jgi:hypothetical protein
VCKIGIFVVFAMLYRNFVAALEITQATFWRGARVVMEQFAKLSTGNRRRGSNPRLSAKYEKKPAQSAGFFYAKSLSDFF